MKKKMKKIVLQLWQFDSWNLLWGKWKWQVTSDREKKMEKKMIPPTTILMKKTIWQKRPTPQTIHICMKFISIAFDHTNNLQNAISHLECTNRSLNYASIYLCYASAVGIEHPISEHFKHHTLNQHTHVQAHRERVRESERVTQWRKNGKYEKSNNGF